VSGHSIWSMFLITPLDALKEQNICQQRDEVARWDRRA
jgi:hypothetical protein